MTTPVLTLNDVERQARAARDLAALSFSMANDAWSLLGFRQAIVLHKRLGGWKVRAVSGLVEIGDATPYQNWLSRVARHLETAEPSREFEASAEDRDEAPILQALTPTQLPATLAGEWTQWWPATVQMAWLLNKNGAVNGVMLVQFDQPIEASRRALLARLTEVWQHAWALLSGTSKSRWQPGRAVGLAALGLGVAALFIPVPQSVLAPAELVSLQSVVIASPVDGIIKEIMVRPNQTVSANQALFALDDSSLRNRRDVLTKTLGSAQAELLATTQKAFDSSQSRGDLAPLKGRVEERRAELAYIDDQLKRSVIAAPKAGIVVFGDPNDWRGRPIAAGERVLLLADPAQLGVLLHVPVADAIAIEPGATIRVFLHVAPLKPMDGKVIETGYQAMLSPDNIASYRLRAQLDLSPTELGELNRIGLKGTAKILGPKVSLGYLLCRRPLALAREWLGL
jgi:multidrug resistance efflux pump